MTGFDEDDVISALREGNRESIREIMYEKDRLISLQEKDMESLKREIHSLKQQLNCSKRKKKYWVLLFICWHILFKNINLK